MFQMQYPKIDTSSEDTERWRRLPAKESVTEPEQPAPLQQPQHVVDEPSIPNLPIG